jgi:hypothetical protein
MTSYIGTSTSRVDGRAKVTGGAQYAGEFKAPNLVYASVVTSSIARGRIARIDTGQALAVVSSVFLCLVVNVHQGGREPSYLRFLGEHQRDRLVVELDLVVVTRKSIRPTLSTSPISRAAMPRRPTPPRPFGTKASTSSRSNITIRWNCLRRR